MKATSRFHNLIEGKWVDALDKQTHASTNPADKSDSIGEFPSSQAEDMELAIKAARGALPRWKSLSGSARGEILRRAADILESRLEEIAKAMVRENGKSIAEARGETARCVALLRYYAGEGVRSVGDVIPSVNPETFIYTTRTPLGVVGIITPWNFPLAIPIWKIAPALVYGNTVVFKPSNLSPHCGVLLAQVFEKAGIPAGVLNLVLGSGGAMGSTMVCNKHIDGISFTGSNSTGRQIAVWGSEHGVKTQLEMGGKNPVIVLPDCNLEQAVDVTVRGAFAYAGQKCTATSRAIVIESIYDEFADRLVDKTRRLKIGPGIDESSFVPPVICDDEQTRILGAIEQGKSSARLLCGGGVPQGDSFQQGCFVEPTVFGDVSPDSPLAQEEIFGPVLALMRAQDFDEAIDLANGIRYGLSASIFTRDIDRIQQYIDRIEAGVIKVNGETAGIELQAPFGGMKQSSSHSREQGRAAIDFFTNIKTVYVDRAGGL